MIASLRRGRAGVGTRLAASVISAQFLSAGALAGAWCFAMLVGSQRPMYYYVRDEYVAVAFAMAGGAWLIGLAWIWRGAGGGRFPVRALVATAGIVVFTILAGVALDEMMPRADEEYLIAAICLAASGAVVMIWVPAIQRMRRGRPVFDTENLVNVHCPECGYSLIGLRELRCPECGTGFTIDDLIRRQDYGDVRTGRSGDKSPVVLEPTTRPDGVPATSDIAG